MLITDLDGIVDYEPLLAATRLLTRRSHSLHVLVPHAEAIARPASNGLEHDLRAIYRRAEQRRLREATLSLVAPDQLALTANRRKLESARVA